MNSVTGPDGKNYKSVTALCRNYGISKQVYLQRIQRGWDKDKAVLYPPGSEDARIYAEELRHERREKQRERTGGKRPSGGRKTESSKKKTDYAAYTVPIKGFIW